MKQETKRPLYKVLNEQRTKGEWTISKSVMEETAIVVVGETQQYNRHIATLPLLSTYSATGDEYKANAQYTALAVNNLHHLAEALEGAIKLIEKIDLRSSIDPFPELTKAKEALNRIS